MGLESISLSPSWEEAKLDKIYPSEAHLSLALRKQGRSGFTLIEMVLSIALVMLFSTLFIFNTQSLFRQSELDSLEGAFWLAVDKARQKAVFQKRPYSLSFDEERIEFVIRSGEISERFGMDTGSPSEDFEARVVFRESLPEDSYKLIGGQLIDYREIEKVVFYPDGTCAPFSVDISGLVFQIDPWTGSQLILPEEEA